MHEAGEPLLAYFDERFPLAAGTDPAAGVREILWPSSPTGRSTGARAHHAATTGASSTSTSSPACVWSSPEVFEASHQLILDLAGRGLIQGLRIDHVDGLTDPKAYLDRLQRRLAEVRLRFGTVLHRGREDPDRRGAPAGGLAGGRDHRLRVHERDPGRARRSSGPRCAGRGCRALHRIAAGFRRYRRGGQERRCWPSCSRASSTVLARRASAVCGLDEAMAADALRRLLVAFPVYRTYAGDDLERARRRGVGARRSIAPVPRRTMPDVPPSISSNTPRRWSGRAGRTLVARATAAVRRR